MPVLLLRFSSIGDIVLTTPVIRAVAEQTGRPVHFLTKKRFATVLASNPYIERLWTIDKDLSEVVDELLKVRFTHVIDLHGNLRTLHLRALLLQRALSTRARAPKFSTFNKLNLRKALLTTFHLDTLPDDVHIVDRYLTAAASLGVSQDGKGLDYFISEADRVDLASENLPPRYLAFVIGAAHATKRLEPAQMYELCRRLPHPILLLGGPDDRTVGDHVATAGPHVTNTAGRFSLNQSADLVRQAAAVLTHDTGLMHIAAAFGKPILSVWGNTVPAFGMYPYLPGREAEERDRRAEVHGLSCRPCSKIGHEKCPKGHFNCMRRQNLPEIAQAVNRLMG